MTISEPLKKIAQRVVPRTLREMRLKLKQPLIKPNGVVTYSGDGLITIHNSDFLNDARFTEAYRLGEATGSWRGSRIHWRAYILCWAAEHAKRLSGDFVECGVNRGGFSRMIVSYIDFPSTDKTIWLVDTYKGLIEEQITDTEARRGIVHGSAGGYTECYNAVCKTFAPFKARVIRGMVPDALTEVTAEQIGYLSIDMNCTAPEIAAAEYFWDKLVPGAVIVLDDYGWSAHIEQKLAFDDFARHRGTSVLALPTGQGLIFKP